MPDGLKGGRASMLTSFVEKHDLISDLRNPILPRRP